MPKHSYVTWLHLSDLHCFAPTNWDAGRVLRALTTDLALLREKYDLTPQVLFFTGDAAWGQVGTDKGRDLKSQFDKAREFLDECFQAIRPDSDKLANRRDIYLVPGNHDIDRGKATRQLTEWLNSKSRTLDEIRSIIQGGGDEWKQYIERLRPYRDFLQTTYEHILVTNPDRLFYCDVRELSSMRIGIAGFNSAWSCTGEGPAEKGRIWCGVDYQSGEIEEQLSKEGVKLRIALIHHPSNWYRSEEDPGSWRRLQRDYNFLLHGHEHQEWVHVDGHNSHFTLSAGAAYEASHKENGYNIVRLDVETGNAEVWLRRYDATGGGWVAHHIHGKTDELGVYQHKYAEDTLNKAVKPDLQRISPIDDLTHRRLIDPVVSYEHDFGKRLARKLDWIELFGVDVPRGSQQYSLSVAYVSLSLSGDENEEADESEGFQNNEPLSMQAEDLFDALLPSKKRILIQGSAGSGKTTLLRWMTIQAANRMAGTEPVLTSKRRHLSDHRLDVAAADHSSIDKSEANALADSRDDWRDKVPFLIRLRDCPEGKLPRPQDFPRVVLKELRDPPDGWVESVLAAGRAMILLDGVDEVPEQYRRVVEQDIRNLISTYSDADNYLIITTRPDAVDDNWAVELGFERIRVQPLTPTDRDDFIDRWHRAVERRLGELNEPEDLQALSKKLKQVLRKEPRIAQMANWPLLCAVICAVHKQRRESLPQTQVELCELLCKMLLERRDKERPGLENQSFVSADYGSLLYGVRKGLLAHLAYAMINQGKSSFTESAVDDVLKIALTTYPAHANRPVERIRDALIVRSGILINDGGNIEFLHNTLKEYLAAEVFVNSNQIDILCQHASDKAWQPIILFAVALQRTNSPVPSQIITLLLQNLPPVSIRSGVRSKAERKELANLRAKQVFLLRCRAQVDQLSPELTKALEGIAGEIFPPRNLTDAEALASCGVTALPYLRFAEKMGLAQRAACVRALRLIGGEDAKMQAREFASSIGANVWAELIRIIDPDEISSLVRYVNQYGDVPTSIERLAIRDPDVLSRLCKLTRLERLWLSFSSLSNLSPVAGIKSLRKLYISDTFVSDLWPLSELTELETLAIGNTFVEDLKPLLSLSKLRWLDLNNSEVRDFSPIARLGLLEHIDFTSTGLPDVLPLIALTSLRTLILKRTPIAEIESLGELTRLTAIDLSYTDVAELSVLQRFGSLESLNLERIPAKDYSSLVGLTKLKSLVLSRTQFCDCDMLVRLVELVELNLSDTAITDVQAVGSLQLVSDLDLTNTDVMDFSPLRGLGELQVLKLSLGGKRVLDNATIEGFHKLRSLSITNIELKNGDIESEAQRYARILPQCKIAVIGYNGCVELTRHD